SCPRLSRSASRDGGRRGLGRAAQFAAKGYRAGSCRSRVLNRLPPRYSSAAAPCGALLRGVGAATASGDSRTNWDRSPPRRSLQESASAPLAPPDRGCTESEACGLCPLPSVSPPPDWVGGDRFRLTARPGWP